MSTDISHISNILQHNNEKEQDINEEVPIYISLLQHYILCGELNAKNMSLLNENMSTTTNTNTSIVVGSYDGVLEMANEYCNGAYMKIVCSKTAMELFGTEEKEVFNDDQNNKADSSSNSNNSSVVSRMQERVKEYCNTTKTKSKTIKMIEVELIGISALNLYLQMNYTGPSLAVVPQENNEEEKKMVEDDWIPHVFFRESSLVSLIGEDSTTNRKEKETHRATTAILSELSVDGEWPHQLSDGPYFLLLARSILLYISTQSDSNMNWLKPVTCEDTIEVMSGSIFDGINDDVNEEEDHLTSSRSSDFSLFVRKIWSARAAVAHQRLMNNSKCSTTLWNEVKEKHQSTLSYLESIQPNEKTDNPILNRWRTQTMLEYGLAQHHFDILSKGKDSFKEALQCSKLKVEVTGAFGMRTKFQTKATAQMLVKASPASSSIDSRAESEVVVQEEGNTSSEMILDAVKHSEDEVLLEQVHFQKESNNQHEKLSFLELSILLALCLDVKNQNPNECVLTGEEMCAYLERVLVDHDDWMIYSTSLLERAWLEFESTHKRERALLQIQALADQHTNRLTLTQSTFQSISEHSAPVQDRLRNIHFIVYPPRWALQQDLAERYTTIGIFSSAADIYETLEMWDEVVKCLQASGRETRAKDLVERRLEECETPRMWSALGDLTSDPACYEKAIALSNHRFFDAFAALGRYHFNTTGDLVKASSYLKEGLTIKPLATRTWFLLGTISMRLEDWDAALNAFSQVVQQDTDEGDAWANVAAVHMKRKDPSKAYHALTESLKQGGNRNSWRVWLSKLYCCIDLQKFDEAIMACHQLLKFQQKKTAKDGILIEEKCIKAVVGGCVTAYEKAIASRDAVSIECSKRTLTRVNDLLDSISSSMTSDGWIWETHAYLKARTGGNNNTEQIVQDLSKEYRTLQAYKGWETDTIRCKKVCRVASDIYEIQKDTAEKKDLIKCKYMITGLIKKIHVAFMEESDYPEDLVLLDEALEFIERRILKEFT